MKTLCARRAFHALAALDRRLIEEGETLEILAPAPAPAFVYVVRAAPTAENLLRPALLQRQAT